MRYGLLAMLLAAMAGVPPAAAGEAQSASFFTGKDLYARLTDWKRDPSKDVISASIGYGFVIGVSDAIHGYKEPRTGFCYRRPNGVTTVELVNIVYNYLEKRPNTRHLSAWSITVAALAETFPCSVR